MNGSSGIVWDWSPKGYAMSNCSHQNQSCNPHKRLRWQVHKAFNHTNITTHLDHPVIWHGSGMSPRFSQLDQGLGQGEIWKLALSLKKFQIWDGCYSLTFNTSANWIFYIQACVRDPYVLLKRTISINESVQELFCQD